MYHQHETENIEDQSSASEQSKQSSESGNEIDIDNTGSEQNNEQIQNSKQNSGGARKLLAEDSAEVRDGDAAASDVESTEAEGKGAGEQP